MAVSEATTSTSKSAAALPTFPLDAGSSNALLYLVLLVCVLLLASIGVVIWWIVKAVYQVDNGNNGGKDDQDQDDQVEQEQGKAGSVSSSKIAVKTGGGVCKNSVLTKTKTQTSGQQQQQKKKLPSRKDFGPKDFCSPKNF